MEKLVKVSSKPEELRKRADQIEQIITLAKSGKARELIAYEFGITRSAVDFILAKNNAN